MTEPTHFGIIPNTSNEPVDGEALLSPLFRRSPVYLQVSAKLPKKTRDYPTTLALVPVEDSSWVLAAMPPYGSELLDLRSEVTTHTFVRVGLSPRLSRALADALNKLRKRHGNSSRSV